LNEAALIGLRAQVDALVPHLPQALPDQAVFDRIRQLITRPDISPLRYPGGKRKLALLVAYTFATAERPVRLLVEPFAGGAAVSIALLEAGFVGAIVLADRDDLVASFWRIVFSPRAEQLARMVERAEVSVERRDEIVASKPRSDLGRAFKCIYLNRTTFSGILNSRGGPLGGRDQSGENTIGCRFNQPRLAARIRELSDLRNRVWLVACQSYEKTVADVRGLINLGLPEDGVFWYFDPPFFEKADRLYRHTFFHADHQAFREALVEVPGSYVLSYDDVPAAEAMYGKDLRAMTVPFGRTYVPMVYAAAERDLRSAKEIIVSNLLVENHDKMAVHDRTRATKARPLPRKPRS
jgi:DNA adenine methylase